MRSYVLAAAIYGGGLAIAPALAQYGNICPAPPPPSYRGPGDTTPGTGAPGGPGTGSPGIPGAPVTPSDIVPGSTPAGPTTGAPSAPSGPTTGGGPTGTPGVGPTTCVGLDLSLPLDAWDRWWAANRERFLELRLHLESTVPGPVTGEDAGDSVSLGRVLPQELRSRVAEHLLGLLEGRVEASSTELDAALLAAAKLAHDPARTKKALQQQLRGGAQRTRELAALALGLLGEPSSAPLLVALARDLPLARSFLGAQAIDARTRAFAIYGLGLLGQRAVDAGSCAQLAREALLEILKTSSKEASQETLVAAVSALGILPTDERELWTACYPALESALLAKQSDFVRAHVPTAVARLDVRPWCERLVQLATSDREHPLVRASAVLALGRSGKGTSTALRSRIVRALDAARARTDGFSESSFALLALAQIGDQASLARFERELEDGAHLEKPWIALGLGLAARDEKNRGADPATRVQPLRRALRAAKAPETRGAIAIAIGLAGDAEAAGELRRAFAAERIGRTRGHLAIALGLIGDVASAPTLRRALAEKGRDAEELSELATALGLLRDAEAVPLLIELLRKSTSVAELGPLARALGRIGEARAAEALLALAVDPNASQLARTYATAGLGVVFDAGPLPWSAPYAEGLNYWAATPALYASGGLLDLL